MIFRRPLGLAATGQQLLGVEKLLAYRDTWVEPPSEDFSMERIIFRHRMESQVKSMAKLECSENGFRRIDKNELTDAQKRHRAFQSAMNKLTEQNYDAVMTTVLQPELFESEQVTNSAVDVILAKAVAEPVFASLYAGVLTDISNYEKTVNPALDRSSVRLAVLSKCQGLFIAYLNELGEDPDAAEEKRKKNKAIIKFLGELFMKSTVSEKSVENVCLTVLNEMSIISDARIEPVLSLLNHVGEKYDAIPTVEYRTFIWNGLAECQKMMTFSTRIRFLIQNLLERRESGWKSKNGASPDHNQSNSNTESTTTDVQTNHTTGGGYSRGGGGWPNNSQAANRGSGATHYSNNRGGNSLTNYPPVNHHDARQGNNNNSGNNNNRRYMESNSSTSPHNSPTDSSFNVEGKSDEKKMMYLATPPSEFTEEDEQFCLSCAAEAATENNNWDSAMQRISKVLKPGYMSRMCGAYAFIKKICLTSKEEERQEYSRLMDCMRFEPSALSRGFAWFLTYCIAQDIKEDVPLVYTRLWNTIRSSMLPFTLVLRDVLARSANYLDALSTQDESEVDQEAELVDFWTMTVQSWPLNSGDPASPAKVLEALEQVKQRQFMQNIALDCLALLLNKKFITEEAVSIWLEDKSKQADTSKIDILLGQLKDLIEF